MSAAVDEHGLIFVFVDDVCVYASFDVCFAPWEVGS